MRKSSSNACTTSSRSFFLFFFYYFFVFFLSRYNLVLLIFIHFISASLQMNRAHTTFSVFILFILSSISLSWSNLLFVRTRFISPSNSSLVALKTHLSTFSDLFLFFFFASFAPWSMKHTYSMLLYKRKFVFISSYVRLSYGILFSNFVYKFRLNNVCWFFSAMKCLRWVFFVLSCFFFLLSFSHSILNLSTRMHNTKHIKINFYFRNTRFPFSLLIFRDQTDCRFKSI